MLPRVILFNAVSLDGRINHFDADIGKFYELAGQITVDAILGGSDTMLSSGDQIPAETVNDMSSPPMPPDDRRPLLVIVDSRGRVRSWHYWRQQPYWRAGVSLCSQSTPKEHLDYLRRRNIDYILTGEDKVDLRQSLEQLNARYGIKSVRVESGGTLNGVLLRAGLVSEVNLLIHPCLVGGFSPHSFFMAPDLPVGQTGIPLHLMHCESLDGGLVWLRYEVQVQDPPPSDTWL